MARKSERITIAYKTTVGMTSSIAVVLLENIERFPNYTSNAEAALNYIKSRAPFYPNIDLILSTHALQLGLEAKFVNQSTFQNFYDQLMKKYTETADTLFWGSLSIEDNSYALPVFLKTDPAKAVKLVTFLKEHFKKFGRGQPYKPDYVPYVHINTGIEAFAQYIELIRSSTGTLSINLKSNRGTSATAKVNENNVFSLQKFDFDRSTRELEVFSGSGSRGISKVTLTCSYYLAI